MPQKIKSVIVKPVKKTVLVTNIEDGAKLTKGGIIIPDDNGKERGIRPRWAEVYATGDEIDDLKPGEWVLVAHGRWTRGVDIQGPNGKITLRRVDYPEAILLVAEKQP